MDDDRDNPRALCVHCALPVPANRRKRGGEAACYCCLGCHLVHQMVRAGEDHDEGARANPLLLRLGVGIFLTMNIMAFSGFFYSQQVYGAGGEITAAGSLLASMFSYLLLLMCTLVILLLGAPLLREALESGEAGESTHRLRRLPRIDVNLLILVGVVAAYVVSAYHTFAGRGHLYYDTAAMILVLVTLGGYLDARAKRKAGRAGHALLASLPTNVLLKRGDAFVETPADQVRIDDTVRIRPGDTIAIDGIITQGGGFVDESTLTGESQPRSLAVGDRVMAGAVNLDGMLLVRVTMPAGRRVIDHIKQMLDEARLRQPSIQRLADRVAALFIPLVIVLALAVFAYHGGRAGIESGLLAGLSVLLISCPCALGLAAPLATHHALTRAAAHGLLIDSPATLEKLAAVRTVLFDKTGTLTQGRMQIDAIATGDGVTESAALDLAAALEAAANHPIAHAIIARAESSGPIRGVASELRLIPGRGVEGRVNDSLGPGVSRNLRLGNAALARESGCAGDPLLTESSQQSSIFLIESGRVLARFTLSDAARPEAPAVMRALRERDMRMKMLTGDQPGPAARLAGMLSLDFAAALLPADKVAHLRRTRAAAHAPVAFVGDGINDAPVMGEADVGISVGSATDLARQAGHVHLIGDGIARLPLLFDLSREAVTRIRFNLFWAFGYNAIGLTLAALGVLTPIFAASSMIVSSLLIVITSSRPLRCENPDDASSARSIQSAAPAQLPDRLPSAVATS